MEQKTYVMPEDIAKALKIGTITEMHVGQAEGKTVLFITHEGSDYKPFKPPAKPKAPHQKSTRQPKQEQPKTLLDKGVAALKQWKNTPSKPPWEREFGRD